MQFYFWFFPPLACISRCIAALDLHPIQTFINHIIALNFMDFFLLQFKLELIGGLRFLGSYIKILLQALKILPVFLVDKYMEMMISIRL